MNTSNTKLYVGCGLTLAPRDFQQEVEVLKDTLRESYHVYDFVGLTNGSAADVYRWDIGHCVADCDIFVAVCDYPSIGLGWELADATSRNKKVLGVAHELSIVTRLVIGAADELPNFSFRRYGNLVIDVPGYIEEIT